MPGRNYTAIFITISTRTGPAVLLKGTLFFCTSFQFARRMPFSDRQTSRVNSLSNYLQLGRFRGAIASSLVHWLPRYFCMARKRLRLAIASGERLGVVSFGAMNNSICAISETISCGFTMPYSFIKTAVADCAREFARPPLTNSCKESRSSAGTSYPLYRRKFLDPSVYHRLILLRQ